MGTAIDAMLGDRPLKEVFWKYIVLVPALLTASLILIAKFGIGGTALVWGVILFIPIYCIWVGISVWNCASKSKAGTRFIARTSVLIIAGLFVLTIVELFTRWHPQITVKSKLSEALSLSAPARTALGIACSEGTLRTGMSNKDLKLSPPTAYSGQFIASVTAVVQDPQTGVVTIVLKDIPNERLLIERLLFVDPVIIHAGAELVYTGWCGAGGMPWNLTGSVPEKYLP